MDKKPWYLSKTIIGAVITALAPLLAVFDVHLPPELQAQLTDAVILGMTAAGAVLTVVGRVTAKTGISAKRPRGGSLVILLGLAMTPMLTACAAMVAETPAQKVYALQSDYASLQTGALAYLESGHADPAAAAAIAEADSAAYDALMAAQVAVRDGDSPVVPALVATAEHAVGRLARLVRASRAPPTS